MKMNVYEYEIKNGRDRYVGSYTVVANCKNEKKLQQQLKSKLVDSFDH